MPKVSVIMAVEGDHGFLSKAVESVLGQTLHDLQLIVVDSSADTEAVRSLFGIPDRRLMILSDKTGLGPGHSLNLALDKAAGDYIARMEADALSMPHRLEKQAAYLDAHPEVGLLGTAWQTIFEDGGTLKTCRAYGGKQAPHLMCHGTAMMRRALLDKAGRYRDAFRWAYDYDVWLRLSELGEAAALDETLYRLRIPWAQPPARQRIEAELYASLALDMAEERARLGKDELDGAVPRHAEAIVAKKFSHDGAQVRRALIGLRHARCAAALQAGAHGKAFRFAMESLGLGPLELRSWKLLLKALLRYPALARKAEALRYRWSSGRRRDYWDEKAADVHAAYGEEKGDFDVLGELLASTRARRVLDVGCGSGRLFPVYARAGVKEVVGQDVSQVALRLAREGHPGPEVSTVCRTVRELDYPEGYFDLVVSNRVLQHVPGGEVERCVDKLCSLGKAVYVNELTASDGLPETPTMFRHDYERLFGARGFKTVRRGSLGRQTWRVFGRGQA